MARLPIEPLRAWIDARLARVKIHELAEQMGVSERQLYRWREEGELVNRDVVEDALHRVGVGLWELYDVEVGDPAEWDVPERFWRLVPHRPEDPDECWLWCGVMNGSRGTNPTFSLRRSHNTPAARPSTVIRATATSGGVAATIAACGRSICACASRVCRCSAASGARRTRTRP
jgi:hypothetical protein